MLINRTKVLQTWNSTRERTKISLKTQPYINGIYLTHKTNSIIPLLFDSYEGYCEEYEMMQYPGIADAIPRIRLTKWTYW